MSDSDSYLWSSLNSHFLYLRKNPKVEITVYPPYRQKCQISSKFVNLYKAFFPSFFFRDTSISSSLFYIVRHHIFFQRFIVTKNDLHSSLQLQQPSSLTIKHKISGRWEIIPRAGELHVTNNNSPRKIRTYRRHEFLRGVLHISRSLLLHCRSLRSMTRREHRSECHGMETHSPPAWAPHRYAHPM